MERLGFANHGLMTGKSLSERPKAAIRIDVINDNRTVGSQSRPGSIQLETYVAFSMQAVVNEEIDVA